MILYYQKKFHVIWKNDYNVTNVFTNVIKAILIKYVNNKMIRHNMNRLFIIFLRSPLAF